MQNILNPKKARTALLRRRIEIVARGIAKSHLLNPDHDCRANARLARKMPFWKLFTSDARKIIKALDELTTAKPSTKNQEP